MISTYLALSVFNHSAVRSSPWMTDGRSACRNAARAPPMHHSSTFSRLFSDCYISARRQQRKSISLSLTGAWGKGDSEKRARLQTRGPTRALSSDLIFNLVIDLFIKILSKPNYSINNTKMNEKIFSRWVIKRGEMGVLQKEKKEDLL